MRAINLGGATETIREDLLAGDRRALAKAITLIESTRTADRDRAEVLLTSLRPPVDPALRVGLSGTPGVGKSTFVEALGIRLAECGHRIAVLAVDPSSTRSGGSILGDKTRMERLARHPNAFIRPSPAGAQLGGVARRTRDVIRLVEAAGFDIVLVETVGVGQSETMVADMTDVFLLLLAPAGGDELQGVKRGIMELADLILINKADGDLLAEARATCADYASALSLLRRRPGLPDGFPTALTVSAVTGDGLDEAWKAVTNLAKSLADTGVREIRRKDQHLAWFRAEFERALAEAIAADPDLAGLRHALEEKVRAEEVSPTAAARSLAARILRRT